MKLINYSIMDALVCPECGWDDIVPVLPVSETTVKYFCYECGNVFVAEGHMDEDEEPEVDLSYLEEIGVKL